MDHLAILEKLTENNSDILVRGSALYIYSAAIYDTWSTGSELEKNLINRLLPTWTEDFLHRFDESYRHTKYNAERPERDVYFEKWVADHKKHYSDHRGFVAALEQLRDYGA